MTYRFAFAAALLLATASPVIGQIHPPSHDRNRQHGPDHVRPDSATHAALHALLHGRWEGTMSHRDRSTPLSVSITRDSAAGFVFAFRSNAQVHPGAAKHITVQGEKLQWDQIVDGRACKASAALSKSKEEKVVMKGFMKCDRDEIAFTLNRAAAN